MKQLIIGSIACVLVFSACKKQLDQEPESTASKTAVFGSEKGLALYINSFYDNIPDANSIHRGDEMSDYGARTSIPDFLSVSGYTSLQGSGWSWSGLRNINYFIVNNNNPVIAADIRRNYTAIARFFRALFYFEKVKRFGAVPWVNKPLDVNDSALYNGRDPRTLVMDSVLADLNFACENITASDNTRSLVTKYVAYAFKSRICLFEGTFRKYHDKQGGLAEGLSGTATKWLTEAATAAEKVMNEGGFSLNTTGGSDVAYRQLFINNAPVNSEIILSDVCDASLSILNDANWYWTSATYGARLSFVRTFVNTYLSIDGTPFTNKAGYATMPFVDEVKNRDKRLQQTIRMGSYKRNNAGTLEAAPPVFSYTYTGYQPIKWTMDDASMDGGTRNTNSISVIRYGEVLLNYAEAKAEAGTLTDADWTKTIGALRSRAGITGGLTTKPTVADPYLIANYFADISDPVLLEVRRERGIELAWEGLRFYDLVRWHHGELLAKQWNGFYVPALNTLMDLNGDGVNDVCFYKTTPPTPAVSGVTYVNVAATLSTGAVNPQRLTNDTYGELTWLNNVTRKWEDKKYLYPIPQNDYLQNPKLGQNPGW
ncbi:MAG: RagB/SusD family nutrient uptake outer membrane protein [Chitinophagaceae bacterium]